MQHKNNPDFAELRKQMTQKRNLSISWSFLFLFLRFPISTPVSRHVCILFVQKQIEMSAANKAYTKTLDCDSKKSIYLTCFFKMFAYE